MPHFSEDFLGLFPSNDTGDRSLDDFCVKAFTSEQKLAICTEHDTGVVEMKHIAEYLHLQGPKKLYRLKGKRNQGATFQDKSGYPEKVDEIGIECLRNAIVQAKSDRKPWVRSRTRYEILQQAKLTDLRHGGSGLGVTMSERAKDEVEERIGLTYVSGQTTTTARDREKRDIRNNLSMACMNEAYAKDKLPHLIGNTDACQFTVSLEDNEVKAFIHDHPEEDGTPVTSVNDAPLNQAVKWTLCCNGNGNVGSDVFLISDSTLAADDMKHYLVPGLSHSSDPKANGYLCVTKTRAGNYKYFDWYLKNIVVPFAGDCRDLVADANCDDDSFYMTMDGEELQISPLEDDNVADILADNKIDVGKGPASSTGTIGNACDRSNIFKATKKVNGKSTKSTVQHVGDFVDTVLQGRISHILSTNHGDFYTAGKLAVISKGIVRIAKSLGKVINHQIIKHGFERIGMYPLDHEQCCSVRQVCVEHSEREARRH